MINSENGLNKLAQDIAMFNLELFFKDFALDTLPTLKITDILKAFKELDTGLSEKKGSDEKEKLIKVLFEDEKNFKIILDALFTHLTIDRAQKNEINLEQLTQFYKTCCSLKEQCGALVDLFPKRFEKLHAAHLKMLYEAQKQTAQQAKAAKKNLGSPEKSPRRILSPTNLAGRTATPSPTHSTGRTAKHSKNVPSTNGCDTQATPAVESKVSFEIKQNLEDILTAYQQSRALNKPLSPEDALVVLQKLHEAHENYKMGGRLNAVEWDSIKVRLRKETSTIRLFLEEVADNIIPGIQDTATLAQFCYQLNGSYILHEKLYASIESKFNMLVPRDKLNSELLTLNLNYTNRIANTQEQAKHWPSFDDLGHLVQFFTTMRCENVLTLQTCCDAACLVTTLFLRNKKDNKAPSSNATERFLEQDMEKGISNRFGSLLHNLFILAQTLSETPEYNQFKTRFAKEMTDLIIDFLHVNNNPNYWMTTGDWKHWLCFVNKYASESDYKAIVHRCKNIPFKTSDRMVEKQRKSTRFELNVKKELNTAMERLKITKFKIKPEHLVAPYQFDHFVSIEGFKFNYTIEADGDPYHHLFKIHTTGRIAPGLLDGKSFFKKKWAFNHPTTCLLTNKTKFTIAVNVNQKLFNNDTQDNQNLLKDLFLRNEETYSKFVSMQMMGPILSLNMNLDTTTGDTFKDLYERLAPKVKPPVLLQPTPSIQTHGMQPNPKPIQSAPMQVQKAPCSGNRSVETKVACDIQTQSNQTCSGTAPSTRLPKPPILKLPVHLRPPILRNPVQPLNSQLNPNATTFMPEASDIPDAASVTPADQYTQAHSFNMMNVSLPLQTMTPIISCGQMYQQMLGPMLTQGPSQVMVYQVVPGFFPMQPQYGNDIYSPTQPLPEYNNMPLPIQTIQMGGPGQGFQPGVPGYSFQSNTHNTYYPSPGPVSVNQQALHSNVSAQMQPQPPVFFSPKAMYMQSPTTENANTSTLPQENTQQIPEVTQAETQNNVGQPTGFQVK